MSKTVSITGSRWVLPFIFFETYLTPMFHLAGLSFKYSMFIVLGRVLVTRKIPSFILPIVVMVVALWLGKFYALGFLRETGITQTIRCSMNYILIALGFVLGYHIRRVQLNWVFPLGIAYAVINIALAFVWNRSPFLIDFYNLAQRVETNLFVVRNPGIFTNPNGSSMVMNLILIFWVVGNRYGLIRKNILFDIIIFSLGAIALITMASKSGLLGFACIATPYFASRFNVVKGVRGLMTGVVSRSSLMVVVVVLVMGTTGVIKGAELYESSKLVRSAISTVVNIDKRVMSEFSKDHNVDGSRIYKLKAALANFCYSPVFGVGSDRAKGGYLNSVAYHNDWSEVLVSSGLIGVLMLFVVVVRIYRLSPYLVVPFLFPGVTNCFLFTVQLVMAYFVFVGVIYRKRYLENDSCEDYPDIK